MVDAERKPEAIFVDLTKIIESNPWKLIVAGAPASGKGDPHTVANSDAFAGKKSAIDSLVHACVLQGSSASSSSRVWGWCMYLRERSIADALTPSWARKLMLSWTTAIRSLMRSWSLLWRRGDSHTQHTHIL